MFALIADAMDDKICLLISENPSDNSRKTQEEASFIKSKLCLKLNETPKTSPCSTHNIATTDKYTPNIKGLQNTINDVQTFNCTPRCSTSKNGSYNGKSPLRVPVESLSKRQNLNSNPRRSCRKSLLNKSAVQSFENQQSLNIVSDEIIKSNVNVNEETCTNELDIPLFPISNLGNETPNKQKENELKSKKCYDSAFCSEKLNVSNLEHTSDCDKSFEYNNSFLPNFKNSHAVALSEPRRMRNSVNETISSRRLCFSSKKTCKQNRCVPEYDPDNDVFLQGVMPVQYNIDSLKNEIGKFLSAVPQSLKMSRSCGSLNKCSDVVSTDLSTPKKKQSKPTPRSPSKLKRAISAPDLLVRANTVTQSNEKKSFEGTIKAYLRARDIIKNIRQRTKDLSRDPLRNNCASDPETRVENNNQYQSVVKSNRNLAVFNSVSKSSQLCESDPLQGSPNSFEDLSLPLTQPFESLILCDVVAYVEVISNKEDFSAGVRTELVKLGAQVVPSFRKDLPVTHVVFNDGLLSTYKKAKSRNVPLVSVLWIEQCRKAGMKVHESLFPPYQIEKYESPSIAKELKKRKIKRFYPEQRPSPRQKKAIANNGLMLTSNESPSTKTSEEKTDTTPKWIDEVAGDNNMVRILVNMTGMNHSEFNDLMNRPPTPDSDLESNINSPLAVRLLRKITKTLPKENKCDYSPKNAIVATSPNEIDSGDKPSIQKINEHFETPKRRPSTTKCKIMNAKSISFSSEKQDSSKHCSDLNLSNVKSTSGTKTCSKRKLLSTVEESVHVSNNGKDVESTVVQNPHKNSSVVLNVECVKKKRKSDEVQKECIKSSVHCEPVIENHDISLGNNAIDPIRRSRRSSAYFVKPKRNCPSPVAQKPALVCTLLHSADVDLIASVVDTLGVFVVEKLVTSHTTHVVAGSAKRTMKLLKGMARGCWIVAQEWVLKSFEAREWLDEEEFELTVFSSAVQKYRLEKLSFGNIFKPDIFSSCGRIFVSSRSSAPREDIVELILLCGGKTSSKVNKADIVVGKNYPEKLCVTALWILDSVQYYSCKPFDTYLHP